MHLNQFLNKHLHSVYHRLYVPYDFGAIYNHPFEGFLLVTLGALLSESLASLSVRQATLFFIISICKGTTAVTTSRRSIPDAQRQ
jgi:sphinganine C4-monooxygenase